MRLRYHVERLVLDLHLSNWFAAVAVDRCAIAEQLYGCTRQTMSNYLMNPSQFHALRPDQWQSPSVPLEVIVKLNGRRVFCS
jgi:hypothetical protein